MLSPSTTTTPNSQDLADLARRIRDEHQAAQKAFANALAAALNAGDALIAAKDRVKAAGWGRWLRENCSMGESTARLFIQLAQHREEIEAEMSRVPGLSLRAARRLIAKPKPALKSSPKSSPPKEHSVEDRSTALANLWAAASPEERMAFLDDITLTELLAVIPTSWKIEIERRVVGNLAARFPKAKPAIRKLLEDTRLLQMEPAGSA